MIEPAQTQKMLVLSTAHLRPKTCNEWLRFKHLWACYEKGEYGWFLHVEGYSLMNDDWDVPKELLAILEYAHKHSFDWIMFDRDGPVQDGLVVYRW